MLKTVRMTILAGALTRWLSCFSVVTTVQKHFTSHLHLCCHTTKLNRMVPGILQLISPQLYLQISLQTALIAELSHQYLLLTPMHLTTFHPKTSLIHSLSMYMTLLLPTSMIHQKNGTTQLTALASLVLHLQTL